MFTNLRTTVAALLCALTLLAGTTSAAFAQPRNEQNGLINVNLENIAAAIPVAIAVPVSVAANVCNISLAAALALSQAEDGVCTATSTSKALTEAMGEAAASSDEGGSGSGGTEQTGLVNVNVSNVALAIPISVALPVGIAANVCNVSAAVLAAASSAERGECTATTEASAEAITKALAMAEKR